MHIWCGHLLLCKELDALVWGVNKANHSLDQNPHVSIPIPILIPIPVALMYLYSIVKGQGRS